MLIMLANIAGETKRNGKMSRSRIVGGRNATLGEVPWIVRVWTLPDYNRGGGTLIRPDVVVTCAHLFFLWTKNLYVRYQYEASIEAGLIDNHDKGPHYQKLKGEEIIIHPDHNFTKDPEFYVHDVGIVMMVKPFVINAFVQIAVLPTTPIDISTSMFGGKVYVAGWGSTNSSFRGPDSRMLQIVDLHIQDEEECRKNYSSVNFGIPDMVFCAGDIGKDTCYGDNGGPAYNKLDGHTILLGIVSYGYNCAKLPGVFTDVFKEKSFIESKLKCIDWKEKIKAIKVPVGPPPRRYGRIQDPGQIMHNARNQNNAFGNSTTGRRVIGGRNASLGEFPWMVRVEPHPYYGKPNFDSVAGGSLITENIVLTAARAFVGGYKNDYQCCYNATVYAGIIDANEKDAWNGRDSKYLVIHPEYKFTEKGRVNDIALVVVAIPYRQTANLKVIKLASPNTDISGDVVFAGWGYTTRPDKLGPLARILQVINISVLDKNRCIEYFKKIYHYDVLENQFCAGSWEHPIEACDRDEGGGLTKKINGEAILLGVYSYGHACVIPPGYPGIYEDVRKHLPFIRKVMDCFAV